MFTEPKNSSLQLLRYRSFSAQIFVAIALVFVALWAKADPPQSVTRVPKLPSWSSPLIEVTEVAKSSPQLGRGLHVLVADTQFWVANQIDSKPSSKHDVLIHRATKILDSSMLGRLGQYPIEFVPEYQKLSIHRISVIRNQQVQDRLEKTQMRVLQREAGLEQGVYSGASTAVLLIDDLRVGDILEVAYSIQGQNPVFAGHFLESASWDTNDPTSTRRVILNHPSDRSIQYRVHGDGPQPKFEPQRRSQNNRVQLIFEGKDLIALANEPSLPSDFNLGRYIEFSEFRDWGSVAQWANGLFSFSETSNNSSPELLALLQQWQQLPSAEDKTRAALRWVQEQIRYFSVSLGESSHRPSSPEQVVQRRYGDCKDKSQLLVSLLRQMGIQADPVLVSQRAPRFAARTLPSPQAFDHVVTKVVLQDKTYYLDPTRLGQRGQINRMGWSLSQAQGLIVHRASQGLQVLKHQALDESLRNEIHEQFSVAKLHGDVSLKAKIIWNGLAAETLRYALGFRSPEQMQRELLNGYEKRYPNIEKVGVATFLDDVEVNQIVLEAEFKGVSPLREYGQEWAIPFTPANLSGVLPVPDRHQRSSPFHVYNNPFEVIYRAQVHWPRDLKMSPTSQLQVQDVVKNDFFELEVNKQVLGHTSSVSVIYKPKAPSVPAKDIPSLIVEVKRLENAIGGAITLAKRDIVMPEGLGDKSQPKLPLMQSDWTPIQRILFGRLDKIIADSTKVIEERRVPEDNLILAHCNRAIAKVDRGLIDEGLQDAQAAIKINADSAEARACRGHALFAAGYFQQAAQDFSKAMSLGEEPAQMSYRRGLARYYTGQWQLAAQDLAHAANPLSSDSKDEGTALYARIWQVWAAKREGSATTTSAYQSKPTSAPTANQSDDWPRIALSMVLGERKPEEVIAWVEARPDSQKEVLLPEAHFYIGQQYLVQGRQKEARQHFEKVRSFGMTLFIEHQVAGFELRRMSALTQ
jgi:lipoprotein NlpI